MENNPLVSIIITVYNVEQYLEECLNSCVSQSYTNIEIVVVNDGSPDNSSHIIERFMAKDSRIIHIQKENEGIAKTRIRGMAESHGDFVTQVDGDDFIDPRAIELMVDKILSTNADMVYSDAYSWCSKRGKAGIKLNPKRLNVESGTDFLTSKLSTFLWGKMYKRSLLTDLTPQSVNISDDMFFNLQILPRCNKVAYLEENLYYYRTNENSLMFGRRDKVAKEYLVHAKERKILCNKPTYPQPIKDMLAYDNISVIYRYLKYVGVDADIKAFIEMSFRDYKFPIAKTIKELRMQIFLCTTRISPRVASAIIRDKKVK